MRIDPDSLRSKHVLMTADTVGGVWTYALELARALSTKGVSFSLATMGAPLTRDQRREVTLLSNVEIFESAFKLEWMKEPWRDVAAAGEWLLEIEQRVRPDVIHLNCYAHGSLSWNAPVVVVAHSCVLSWWRAVHGTSAPSEWDYYRDAVSKGLQAADLVVTPTRAMLRALLQCYGPLPKVAVISNGRRLPRLSRPPKENIILAAGRLWDAAKNISSLDAIASKLRWPVFIAGDETHPDEGSARHLNVRCLGKLPAAELLRWFERASIYVLPARYEPFGLSVLEAALAGCALVLGDISSLRELWDEAAFYISPDDPNHLCQVLNRLSQDPAKLADRAHKAQIHARRYSLDNMSSGYLLAYSRLLEKGSRSQKLEVLAA